MKNTYPIVLMPDKAGYVVYIPDFDINTEGSTLTEAMEMARDAIGLMGIDYEDDGKPLPEPTELSKVEKESDDYILTLVDIDFTEYRRQNDLRSVKKNCTLPSWLCYAAEKANINFSQLLQSAIKKELHISD